MCQGTPHGGTFTSMMKILSSQFWPIPAIAPLSGAGPLKIRFLRERREPLLFKIELQNLWKSDFWQAKRATLVES